MSFIEDLANRVADAANTKVMNAMNKAIAEYVNIADCVARDNEQHIKDHEEMLAHLYKDATDEEKEEYAKLEPKKQEFPASELELFNYGYMKLLEKNMSILHDINKAGDVYIKVYKLVDTKKYSVKSSYSVELQPIELQPVAN
jgi:hypothetical protein